MSDVLPWTQIDRVQSLSHADLHRLLPRVLADVQLDWDQQRCVARFADGRLLEILLSTETERRLGSLRILSTPLQFRFHAWPSTAVASFMNRFERALQQGGG